MVLSEYQSTTKLQESSLPPDRQPQQEIEGEIESDGYYESISESEEIDISEDISGFDFGLVIGAGADVLLSSGTLTFDARYNLGLVNVPDIEGFDVDVKNAVISFMVGYAFALQ